MAEGFAAVGIASSIVQLEFQSRLEDTPKSFRQIKDEVPLLLDILNKTKEAVYADPVKQETAKALLPVVESCREQIESLATILTKILPAEGDSRMRRGVKALSSSIFQDGKVDRITSSIDDSVRLLTLYHAAVSSNLQPRTDEELNKIRLWLSAPDPSPNYQKALGQRLPNTGLWFLRSEQYAQWKIDRASFLWLHGIPGCGKTILSSAIIQDTIQDCSNAPNKVVAYYYFTLNDSRKQIAELMVKSLITQLSQYCIHKPTALQTLFSTNLHGQRQPSLDALLQVLHQLIHDFSASIIVLDALDECTEREGLLHIIEKIAGWQLENLHVIVTSRYEADILASLECSIPHNCRVPLQSKEVDPDISSYVRHRLSNDRNLRRWQKRPEVQREIEAVLMEKAGGMWRWAACQLDTLGRCLNRSMMQHALRNLPRTLDETYDRILCAIEDDYCEYALCILKWLAFSTRPLRMTEVAETVAITFDSPPMFDKDKIIGEPSDILSICSSLVTITSRRPDKEYGEFSDGVARPVDDGTNTEAGKQFLALAHYSVKEYLVSDRIQKSPAAKFSIEERAANTFLAESCLIYLLQFQDQDPSTKNALETYKLGDYAARSWVKHIQAGEQDTKLTYELVRKLFTLGNSAYLNWLRVWKPDGPYQISDIEAMTLDEVPDPIYYASYFGLAEVVRLLIDDEDVDVNGQGGYYGSALQAASTNGHGKVVEQLLSAGADVNMRSQAEYLKLGYHYDNALQVASAHGHEKIVELLLDAGADINRQGGDLDTALQAASAHGHEGIVELLLDAGADVNSEGGTFDNALNAASRWGYEKTVELLVKAGADIDAQGRTYGTAIEAASDGGHEKIVERLINAVGLRYQKPADNYCIE